MVQDGVGAHRGLAGLAVTDDQLALATARSGVIASMALIPGLRWLGDALALHHGRGLDLQRTAGFRLDVALTVDRLTQRVDHATEELVTDRNREHLTGALHLLALCELLGSHPRSPCQRSHDDHFGAIVHCGQIIDRLRYAGFHGHIEPCKLLTVRSHTRRTLAGNVRRFSAM